MKTVQTTLVMALLMTASMASAQDFKVNVSAEELASDIRTLSSDEFEGRGLGSRGLAKAVEWHETMFKELGLEPLFGDQYRQPFTLIGSTPDPKAELAITVPPGKATLLSRLDDWVAVSWNREATIVEAPIAYAGHLIVAPDRKWDDVKEMDLKGRILLVEVNEPGNREGGIFDGPDMTWYGRWAYKFEEAARQGAAGILLIHNEKRAGYGWNVVQTGWSNEDFFTQGRPESTLGFMGWITEDAAKTLLKKSGKSLSILRNKAEGEDFSPIELGMVARLEQKPEFREIEVANVGAMLRSKHPDHQDRYVIVSAHFDHVGTDKSLKGDRVYNGAVDNCSATAAMLGTARHFVRSQESVPFHLVFLGVTAEETGLLGSRYFVDNIPFPTSATWGNINHEMTNVWGPTRDVFVYGAGFSQMTEVAKAAATTLGLTFLDDMVDRGGMSFRSDQLSFARGGIPAVWLHEGTLGMDGKRDARAKREWYLKQRYHQVSDEMEADWDLSGTVQMVQWTAAIIAELAKRPNRPKIAPGSGMATAEALVDETAVKVEELPPCTDPEVAIGRVLRSGNPAFQACYKRALNTDPNVAGKLLLNVTVSPDGTLGTLATEENTLNNAAVQDCILQRVKGMKFPKCQGELRRERFPLFFQVR